jgi:hypothetical protein
MSDAKLSVVDSGLFVEIQRFLFREAALLDRRDYAGWLSLTTDDIRYRITAAVARDAGAAAVDYAIVDEDKTGLKARIDQISNPRLTRAENPPSMVRRVISNIDVRVIVDSMFLDGTLQPLEVQGQPDQIPEWAKVGIRFFDHESRASGKVFIAFDSKVKAYCPLADRGQGYGQWTNIWRLGLITEDKGGVSYLDA